MTHLVPSLVATKRKKRLQCIGYCSSVGSKSNEHLAHEMQEWNIDSHAGPDWGAREETEFQNFEGSRFARTESQFDGYETWGVLVRHKELKTRAHDRNKR